MKSSGSNWNAEDYAKNSSAQLEWARELMAKLCLTGAESLLDIGCGDGKATALLAETLKDGSVLGIDSSPAMIKLASERFPCSKFPNLSFKLMDATDIHLAERFDVAFSNAVLHWVEDHNAVLRGVRACLKPGGKILFQMGGRGNASEIFACIAPVLRRPQWQHYFVDFPSPYYYCVPEQYTIWLSASGFRPVRAGLLPKTTRHEGTDGLKARLRTTWFPYTSRVPEQLRDLLLDEVVDAYITNHPVDSLGKVHVKMVRLEVEAYAV